MKNPFEKDNHTTLILATAIISITAGAVAFLFLTDRGRDTRKILKKKIKSIAKDAAIDAISKKTRIKKKTVKTAADRVVE